MCDSGCTKYVQFSKMSDNYSARHWFSTEPKSETTDINQLGTYTYHILK